MGFVKNYQNFLNEARGVPDNLLNLASDIYSRMIAFDFSKLRFEYDESENELLADFDLEGPFEISDFKILGINIEIEKKIIHGNSEITKIMLAGASQKNSIKGLNNDLQIVKDVDGFIELGFEFLAPGILAMTF